MSPSFARNRLLLMAIAAVLLPIAVVSAAPTQTTDFYNQTTDSTMQNSTENITMSTTQCYCNLPECKVTPDHSCITRLGCFYELQPVSAPAPNSMRFPEIESHTVLVGGILLNGVFGCLESLNEHKSCNEILKSTEVHGSEFPALHAHTSSGKPQKITAYHCCETALCNNPSTISVAMKIVHTVQGTATFFFGSRDLDIDNDNQNNATISVDQSEATENTTVLFMTAQLVNKTILENNTTDIPLNNLEKNKLLISYNLVKDNSTIVENKNSTISSMAQVTTGNDVLDVIFNVVPIIKLYSNSTYKKDSNVTNSTTIEATSESIINHAQEHNINTTQQDFIPETMANSSHNSELEPNSSSISNSNVNPIDKLSMETTSQVASLEPSTNQPKPLINSSDVPEIDYNVSSTSESNVLTLNGTLSQTVSTETSTIHPVDTTNSGETEIVTTTSKITEENEPVGHLIKKRHYLPNETSLLDLDEETVVGYVTLPPEVPVVSTLPLEIDEKITHKKNKTIYPNSYYYNIDVIIGKTCSSGAPWMAIAIAIMSFVILLVLVIIKILLKSNVLNNFTGFRDKSEKSSPRSNMGLQHMMSASSAHAFGPVGLFNGSSEFDFSNVFIDNTGDTTYVYTTIPARSSTSKPVQMCH